MTTSWEFTATQLLRFDDRTARQSTMAAGYGVAPLRRFGTHFDCMEEIAYSHIILLLVCAIPGDGTWPIA